MRRRIRLSITQGGPISSQGRREEASEIAESRRAVAYGRTRAVAAKLGLTLGSLTLGSALTFSRFERS